MDADHRPPPWRDAPFAPLSGTAAILGESPVWSAAHGCVWWVDITGGLLLRTSLDGRTEAVRTPEIPGFVQVIGGALFVGMQSGIFRFAPVAARFTLAAAISATTQRFNDACLDARGRIWAGTMDCDNAADDGVLYLFDPRDGSLRAMAEGFRTINGLAWDEAGGRIFVSDSHPSVQSVWTYAAGADEAPGPPELFADFDTLDGRPDGAAMAPDGCYWIAGVGGGSLYRFAMDGRIVSRFRVPVASPTKPAFLPGPAPGMVLTSKGDDGGDGAGRLALWPAPPCAP